MISYETVVEALIQYPRFRKSPSFKTLNAYLAHIDYSDQIPFIHVVGTNGKGSVVRALSQMYIDSGKKVGMFISPHLVDIRERMTVNFEMMKEAQLITYYNRIMEAITLLEDQVGRPTFFEIMFLMALMHFREMGVDLMILEAGIGGSQDATNALKCKLLSVITSIDYDHMEILGSTLKEIATDKGGIIMKDVPTVLENDKEEVNAVIEGLCQERGSNLIKVRPYELIIFKRGKQNIDFSTKNQYYNYKRLKGQVIADYQLENLQVALTAASVLKEPFKLEADTIRASIEKYAWYGRMTYLADHILVDGGHNLAGVKRLVEHLNLHCQDYPIDLIYGTMGDKDYGQVLDLLISIKGLRHIYLPKLKVYRAEEPTVLKSILEAKGHKDVILLTSMKPFLRQRLSESGARDLLVGVGSLYLVSEMIEIKEED